MLDSIKAGIMLSLLLLLTACSNEPTDEEIKEILTFQLDRYALSGPLSRRLPLGTNFYIEIHELKQSVMNGKKCELHKESGDYYCRMDAVWLVRDSTTTMTYLRDQVFGCFLRVTAKERELIKQDPKPYDLVSVLKFNEFKCHNQ